MPIYRWRQEEGFFLEFLGVVFAEVSVRVEVGVRAVGVVEGEDVGCGFELGDGYEADLLNVSNEGRHGGVGGRGS